MAHPLASAVIYPLNVILWSIMLVMIMWVCITDECCYVNQILSLKFWRPLSRVTYSVYLTHPWVIALLIGARRQPFIQDFGSVFSHLLTVFVLSFIVGLLFSIFFEGPFCIGMEYLKPLLLPKELQNNSQQDSNFEDIKMSEKEKELTLLKNDDPNIVVSMMEPFQDSSNNS